MDALHAFMPTIEVSDASSDKPLACYQSLIIPRIGESISWTSEGGESFTGEVTFVQHEVVKGNVVNICKRVYVSADNIEKWY